MLKNPRSAVVNPTSALGPSGSNFGPSGLAPIGIHHPLLSNLTTAHGYRYEMGMGTEMNPHGLVGGSRNLWIKRKRDKCSNRCVNLAKYSPVCNLFYWHFFFIVIIEYT